MRRILDAFVVALESLAEHKLRTTLTMLGMMFGVGAVIAMLSIGAGAETQALALIDRWQAAVLETRALDYDLACEMADTATVVRGYGEVRRRLSAAFVRVLDEILAPGVARDRAAGNGYAPVRDAVRSARQKLLADEKGIEQAFQETARA